VGTFGWEAPESKESMWDLKDIKLQAEENRPKET